jgi:hypothetical protein
MSKTYKQLKTELKQNKEMLEHYRDLYKTSFQEYKFQ